MVKYVLTRNVTQLFEIVPVLLSDVFNCCDMRYQFRGTGGIYLGTIHAIRIDDKALWLKMQWA